jgi:hypothetical protein
MRSSSPRSSSRCRSGAGLSFRGGEIDCRFGGGVIDLREATLDPAIAHLKVTAMFGGGQILVPEPGASRRGSWGSAGPATRDPDQRDADAPHLTIEGTAMFGGFGIASEMPEAAVQGLEEAVAKAAARHESSLAEASEPVAVV